MTADACHIVCNGQVRIAGSKYRQFGRVEICINDIWGTICSVSWEDRDASVVCNQLGFSTYGT